MFSKACEIARSAPREVGTIEHLINRPEEGVHVPVESLTLDAAEGIIGDRWKSTAWLRLDDGAPDPRVQVSMTNTRVMQCFTGDAPSAVYGCGDNLYVDFCLTEEALPVGTHLQMGDAILELSDEVNDACGKFVQRYGAEAFRFIRDADNMPLRLRGVFLRIHRSGTIQVGDTITAMG